MGDVCEALVEDDIGRSQLAIMGEETAHPAELGLEREDLLLEFDVGAPLQMRRHVDRRGDHERGG